MLLLGGFPLSLLGYFGFAKNFSKFITIQQPLLKSAQSESLFFKIYDSSFQIIDKISTFIFNESAIMMVETFTKDLKNLIKMTLKTIFEDKNLLIGLIAYFAILIIVLMFFRIERYINRIQSRIWNRTKVLNSDISGNSFRDSNPAYKILNK